MRWYRLVFLGFALCWIGLTWGCGGGDPLGRQAVSGIVTLDGSPLQEGSIRFEPTGESTTSSGAVIEQGKYSITKNKGLPPGKYRVVINAVKPEMGGAQPADEMPGDGEAVLPEELIPSEWNAKSQHFIEVVDSGTADFTHDIVTTGESGRAR